MAVTIPDEQAIFLQLIGEFSCLVRERITPWFLDDVELIPSPIGVDIVEEYIQQEALRRNILETFIGRTGPFWHEIVPNQRDFFLQRAPDILYGAPPEFIQSFMDLFRATDANGQHLMEVDLPLWYFHQLASNCLSYLKRIDDPRHSKFSICDPSHFAHVQENNQ